MKKLDSYQIIRRPLITEKGMAGALHGSQYPFEAHINANKLQIKSAVEDIFGVHVQKVRTMIRRGKPRRVGSHRGTTRRWKRAVVTLAPGETIEFM